MWLLVALLSCPVGTLPIARTSDGAARCGSWKDLQAFSRQGGPAPAIALPKGAIGGGGGHFTLTRAGVDALLSAGLGTLARQARLEPRVEGGVVNGFVVSGLRTGSVFHRMGVRNGDLVRSVNGFALTSALHMLALYGLLQTQNPVARVRLKRGAQERMLVWRIVDPPPSAKTL